MVLKPNCHQKLSFGSWQVCQRVGGLSFSNRYLEHPAAFDGSGLLVHLKSQTRFVSTKRSLCLLGRRIWILQQFFSGLFGPPRTTSFWYFAASCLLNLGGSRIWFFGIVNFGFWDAQIWFFGGFDLVFEGRKTKLA